MRRATGFVIGTVTGTALLVGAKLGTAAPGGTAADDPGGTVAVVAGGPQPSDSPTHSPARPKPTHSSPRPGPTHSSTNPTPTPPPAGPHDGTYTASAQVKNGRFGTLSMTVTVSGHRITNIAASESGGESSCYHHACPTLTSEALAAQSAKVNSVSGATYTSDAYRSSLQAVLNSAGK